jgi:hypothetical protein
MKKAWLYVKKYWYIVVGAFLGYLATRTRKTIVDAGEDPRDNPPEELEVPDFVKQLQEKKEANDAKIDDYDRQRVIDDLNRDASRRRKRKRRS